MAAFELAKHQLTEIDLPDEVEGAPCHVQLIGRRLKDEKLIQDAEVVENILNK